MGWVARFRAQSAINLASGAKGAGLEKFLAFSGKKFFLKNRIKSDFLCVWGQKKFSIFSKKIVS